MFKQKSKWAGLGMGAKGRDGNGTSAPIPVSEDAQAKNTRDAGPGLLMEFAPQSRDRSLLPQRPSTSAGPASSFTKRKNAEKRETKDDLHFNPLAAHGKGTTFYNFPLPGALPTPTTTPRSSPPPPREAELARPSTPDSMEIAPGKIEPSPTEIGMALGSPAHPPTMYQSNPADAYHEYMRNNSPGHTDGDSVDGWVNSPPIPKRKPSKWKTLGGLFGGKKNTQAFYQLQPEPPQPPPAPPVEQYVHFDEPQSDKSSMYRGRTKSERKSRKNKPDMKRANTAPLNFELANPNQYQHQPPEITLDGERLGDSGSAHTTHSGGLLDIDIPTIQMERYSIMFSGVLQKSGSTTTSSLLARRQATLDKLKTVNEAIASKEQELLATMKQQRSRRASSPQAKSPAFSLFPSTPSRVREPSPSPYRANLQRSNTSPAMLSPARPSFAPGPENDAHAQILAAAAEVAAREDAEKRMQRAEVRIPNLRRREPMPEPEAEPVKEQVKKPVRYEIMDSPTIVSPNPKWSTEESHLTLDSPTDEEGEVEEAYDPAPLPMKPVLPEPNWQMITPAHGHVATSSASGSTTSRSDHSTSTSASSIMTSPSVASPQPSKTILSPPSGRPRAATTGAPANTGRMRSATTSSTSQIPRRGPNHQTAYADEDEELRLKTAADVSIARQISVSRSQRQLLVPIKSALKQPKNPNLTIEPRNFPVSASGIDIIGVGRVASPLGAVAVAAQEERERGGSPFTDRGGRGRMAREKKPAERLVEGVKPATPTLVVVGNSLDQKEELWQGATQQHLAHSTPVGPAERRRGNDNGHLHLSNTGEIKVGLAVEAAQAKELQNRKSERVVVEIISAASN